jgi:hypothetical protein
VFPRFAPIGTLVARCSISPYGTEGPPSGLISFDVGGKAIRALPIVATPFLPKATLLFRRNKWEKWRSTIGNKSMRQRVEETTGNTGGAALDLLLPMATIGNMVQIPTILAVPCSCFMLLVPLCVASLRRE